METQIKEGRYIYCIISTNQYQTFGSQGIGGRNDEIYTVCYKDIAAVVSSSPIINYSLSKANMLSHTKAIELVMNDYTVLPVRFNTIAEDEDKIMKILEKEYDKFKVAIKKIEGKKELGLKALFFGDEVYKDILEKYKEIKLLKENFEDKKAYNQLVEVGAMVEKALDKEKGIYKDEFLNTLSPLAEKINVNSVFGEKMILNAAFLVEKYKEAEFDQAVHEFDAKYGSKIKFKYVGTVPPFNFVDLVIETGNY